VLSEFRRVLRPAGTIVLASFGFGIHWFNRFWYWLAKAFPALLTNCRPLRIGQTVALAGFHNLHVEHISQNSFPSDIVVAEK
jgi:ubiquinone/menaquinone biosynthesis C-methylase UbiE